MIKVLYLELKVALHCLLTYPISICVGSSVYHFKNVWSLLIHGYSDYEVSDLDFAFFKWFIPRIEQLRKRTIAHPAKYTPEKWDKVLAKLHRTAVACKTTLEYDSMYMDKKEYRQFVYLFAKHLPNLWF